MELNKVYQGDCLEHLKQMSDESIDIVITSPPYFNNDKDYQRNNGKFYTCDYPDVEEHLPKVLNELLRVLKKDGCIFWNFGYDIKHGVLRPFQMIQNFNVYDIIIWNKTNPIPFTTFNRLTKSFEYIFVITKDKDFKFKNLNNRYIKNVWTFAIRKKNQYNLDNHGACFPIDLPLSCLDLQVNDKNMVVLDPFMGTGTTALACTRKEINFIGFEINQEYVDICNKKLSQMTVSEFTSPVGDFATQKSLIGIK